MQPAIDRVFEKIPWTDHPSSDGELYLPQGYNSVGSALAKAGWANVTANDVPGEKNHTFSHTPYMYSHGERGGPMATYLVDADARSNFKLWTNTTVNRVLRNGSHITGVEVGAYGQGGYCGTVNVTPGRGRVILSAGVFGTSKILMRSGIGSKTELEQHGIGVTVPNAAVQRGVNGMYVYVVKPDGTAAVQPVEVDGDDGGELHGGAPGSFFNGADCADTAPSRPAACDERRQGRREMQEPRHRGCGLLREPRFHARSRC